MNSRYHVSDICTCPICFIPYDGNGGIPVVGVCGHTLCKVCSLSFGGADKTKFICPICTRKSDQPLSLNVGLMNVLEIMQFDALFIDNVSKGSEKLRMYSAAAIQDEIGHLERESFFSCNNYEMRVTQSLQLDGTIAVFSRNAEEVCEEASVTPPGLNDYRHPNIARFKGCCSTVEIHALVFERFPNGNLHDCLFCKHAENATLPLTAVERLSIAVDVARGAIFMHRKCVDMSFDQHGTQEMQVLTYISNILTSRCVWLDHTLTAKLLPFWPALILTNAIEKNGSSRSYTAGSAGDTIQDGTTEPIDEPSLLNITTGETGRGVSETSFSSESAQNPPREFVGIAATLEQVQLELDTSSQPTKVVNCSNAMGSVLKAYGTLLFTLVLNIAEDAVAELISTGKLTAERTGRPELPCTLNNILSIMTFTDCSTIQTSFGSLRDTDDQMVEVKGVEKVKFAPVWDRSTARRLISLALQCILGEHDDMTNPYGSGMEGNGKCMGSERLYGCSRGGMVCVLAMLMRIKADMVCPEYLSTSRNTFLLAAPPNSSPTTPSTRRRVIRGSARHPPQYDNSSTSRPVPIPRQIRGRSRVAAAVTVTSSRDSVSEPASSGDERRIADRPPRASVHNSHAAAVTNAVETCNEDVAMAVSSSGTVAIVTPSRASVPAKVYYHPGYFNERAYMKKNRFGGSAEVPPGWRCCGSVQRNHLGCVYAVEKKHHPGKWLGDGRFDCCSSSSVTGLVREGCVVGPQPNVYRSRVSL